MALEKISLKDLVRAGQRELDLHEAYEYDNLPTKGPVDTEAHIQLSSTGLTIRGKYHATIEEPCDRCAEPFQREIDERFKEDFVYSSLVEEASGGDLELHSEDYYESIDPAGALDVKDLIYQLIVLAISHDRICQKETCFIHAVSKEI